MRVVDVVVVVCWCDRCRRLTLLSRVVAVAVVAAFAVVWCCC